MLVDTVENWLIDDWVRFVQGRVQVSFGRPIEVPNRLLQATLNQRLKDVDGNKCLLLLVLENLIDGPFSYMQAVGPTSNALTRGVIQWEVQRMGGFRHHWKSYYYQRFAQSEAELTYFRKYLELLEDALEANSGSPARVGDILYSNWQDVAEIARQKLDRAVRVVKRRFRDYGVQEEWAVTVQPYPREEVSLLVQQVRERMMGRVAVNNATS